MGGSRPGTGGPGRREPGGRAPQSGPCSTLWVHSVPLWALSPPVQLRDGLFLESSRPGLPIPVPGFGQKQADLCLARSSSLPGVPGGVGPPEPYTRSPERAGFPKETQAVDTGRTVCVGRRGGWRSAGTRGAFRGDTPLAHPWGGKECAVEGQVPVCVCVHMYVRAYIQVYMFVHACVCMCRCTCVLMHVCMCLCVLVCTCGAVPGIMCGSM